MFIIQYLIQMEVYQKLKYKELHLMKKYQLNKSVLSKVKFQELYS